MSHVFTPEANREDQRRIKMNVKEMFATTAVSQDTMQTDAQGEEGTGDPSMDG